MSEVAFHRPPGVAEALAILSADPGARPLAGGASMVAMMNAGLVAPTAIVSLRDIAALCGIESHLDGRIRIGAMTRHYQTAGEARLTGTLACLRAAAGSIANPPIRNMGTMGGSISLADPAADYPPALVAAGATIEITGVDGARLVAAREFFLDWYTTAVQAAELVTAVLLPKPEAGAGCYYKLARVAGDFATVSIAMSATSLGRVSVAVGGCGPRPVADDEANALLSGRLSDAASVRAAGEILARRADPVDDVRASADYRRLVIPRLLARTAGETLRALEATG